MNSQALPKRPSGCGGVGLVPCETDSDELLRCPHCGAILPELVDLPRIDASCPKCGTVLWCCQRDVDGYVTLQALRRQAIEVGEMADTARDCIRRDGSRGIILELDLLESISSSFVAGMLVMRRLLQSSGREFILSGLRPTVREILQTLRLHGLFEIQAREDETLNGLHDHTCQ